MHASFHYYGRPCNYSTVNVICAVFTPGPQRPTKLTDCVTSINSAEFARLLLLFVPSSAECIYARRSEARPANTRTNHTQTSPARGVRLMKTSHVWGRKHHISRRLRQFGTFTMTFILFHAVLQYILHATPLLMSI